jgi:hypothetical protein
LARKKAFTATPSRSLPRYSVMRNRTRKMARKMSWLTREEVIFFNLEHLKKAMVSAKIILLS